MSDDTLNQTTKDINSTSYMDSVQQKQVQDATQVFSRDHFLEVFKSFQRDLFREALSENIITESLTQWKKGLLDKTHDILSLYSIQTLRYRAPTDIKKSLKLYYQAVNRLGISSLYILRKEGGIVTITIGSFKTLSQHSPSEVKYFNDNTNVLPLILPGFLPGTTCTPIHSAQIPDFDEIQNTYTHRRIVYGVPGEQKQPSPGQESREGNSQQEHDFGIERVIDAVDKDFMIVGFSTPVSNAEITQNQAIFAAAAEFFHLISKQTEQISHSIAKGFNVSINSMDGTKKTDPGTSETKNYGDAIGTSLKKMVRRWWGTEGWFRGEGTSNEEGKGETARKSETVNKPGESHNHQEGKSVGKSKTNTEQHGITIERTNELARQAEELISKQMKRFEKGLASGMWRHSTQVIAKESLTADRVANILCGYLGGDDVTVAQVKSVPISDELAPDIPILKFGMDNIQCLPDNPFGLIILAIQH